MKIGIEAQRIFRPKKHGMDIVALESIKALVKLRPQDHFVVFVKPDVDKVLVSEGNLEVVEVPGFIYADWEQIALPKAVKAAGVDLLHCTSNTAPIRGLKVPLVVTLHDIIFLEKRMIKEGTNYQKLGNLYRRFVVPRILKKAKKVLTVSQFEKGRIAEFLGGLDTLDYIYNGVSEHFLARPTDPEIEAAKGKYNLPSPYLFFLGNTDPKKNVPNVLKAFKLIHEAKPELKLVVLDYKEEELDNQLQKLGLEKLKPYFHLLGYVPNVELPRIYAGAELFWYPSLRESFGIPILEAQGVGQLVVTSNTSSMPEVGGSAVLLADPNNPEEMAGKVLNALSSDTSREKEMGKINAQNYTWTKAAEKLVKVYAEVLSGI